MAQFPYKAYTVPEIRTTNQICRSYFNNFIRKLSEKQFLFSLLSLIVITNHSQSLLEIHRVMTTLLVEYSLKCFFFYLSGLQRSFCSQNSTHQNDHDGLHFHILEILLSLKFSSHHRILQNANCDFQDYYRFFHSNLSL